MIRFIKDKLKKYLPRKFHLVYVYFVRKFLNQLDDEMLCVNQFLTSKRRFLDVGSNIGIYSYHFKSSFQFIDAFEPIESIPCLDSEQSDFFKIHNIALSDTPGLLDLYTPFVNGRLDTGLSSLETRDTSCSVTTVSVSTIDSFDFKDVDLIKIDVEGHESSVIRGAVATIKNSKPVLIVEIEQRHIKQDINSVFQLILNLGYSGFFLLDGSLAPISHFRYEQHQQPYLDNVFSKDYINNFIFVPDP